MNSRQLAQVGLGLIGVWALLIALLGFFAAGELPTMPSRAGPARFFIGSGVQLAIALFLIMRPQRLLDYVRRPVATTDQ